VLLINVLRVMPFIVLSSMPLPFFNMSQKSKNLAAKQT